MNMANIDIEYYIIPILCLTFASINIIKGIRDGAIKQILSLITVIVSIILTRYLTPIIVDEIIKAINDKYEGVTQFEIAITLIIGLILFYLLNLIFGLILKIFKSINKVPIIGAVNRILGGFIGSIKALVYIWIIFFVFRLFRTLPVFEYVVKLIQQNEILNNIYLFNPLSLIIHIN